MSAVALAALAACSRSSEQPALTDDLKQDLARAGAADVQLAGAPTSRLDVVSAAERTNAPAPTPRAPLAARAPSASRGQRAVVKSVRHETSAPATPAPRAEVAPAEVVKEPAPEPTPSQARPRAPLPSTQREPPGGWRSPGSVIRNAPFPINP